VLALGSRRSCWARINSAVRSFPELKAKGEHFLAEAKFSEMNVDMAVATPDFLPSLWCRPEGLDFGGGWSDWHYLHVPTHLQVCLSIGQHVLAPPLKAASSRQRTTPMLP
jgi:hypothetical protein